MLTAADPEPVGFRNINAHSDFFITCEHAGNAVPLVLDGLGLPPAELDRHIAWDIGILGVAEILSDRLQAPLVHQRYSRLVAECNRRFESAAFISARSDETDVPGNRDVHAHDRKLRTDEIVKPYHDAIAGRLDARKEGGMPTILVSMHSFTPQLRGDAAIRPWSVGLCVGADERFSRHVMHALEREPSLNVGWNMPYAIDGDEYAIPVHAEERGLPCVQIEIRQDLIASASGQSEWAERIATALCAARASFNAEPARIAICQSGD